MAFDTIKDLPIRTESPILFETTCAVCHGNQLQMKRGRVLNNTWPNHGIGRVNTDGSRAIAPPATVIMMILSKEPEAQKPVAAAIVAIPGRHMNPGRLPGHGTTGR